MRGNLTYNNLCIFIVFIFIFPDLKVLVHFSYKIKILWRNCNELVASCTQFRSSTLPPVTNKKMWRIGSVSDCNLEDKGSLPGDTVFERCGRIRHVRKSVGKVLHLWQNLRQGCRNIFSIPFYCGPAPPVLGVELFHYLYSVAQHSGIGENFVKGAQA
jgi:hypothetical protein